MAVYTVYQPPLREAEGAPDPERFVFVRDGFAWLAFLFAPLWMLWHRLWLALLGYVVIAALLGLGVRFVTNSTTAGTCASLVLALLVGLEASSLRRWTLERRRWKNVGIVVGDDLESAERRFFDTWVQKTPTTAAASAPSVAPPQQLAMTALHTPPDEPHIIGLFPEPGAPR